MRILIVGAGKLGYKLAEALSNDENDITVLDISEQALTRVASNLDVLTLKGNGAQLQMLEQLNMKRTHFVIAVTDSDETNMVISVLAKKLGCSSVVARVRNPEYSRQIEFLKEELQIDFIINPELETARDIAKYLLKGYAVHVEAFARGKVGLVDFSLINMPDVVGRALYEIDIFKSILVAAISRDGEIIIPHGGTRLETRDTLYLIGKRENLNAFTREFDLGERRIMKTAMILGGGNAGFYLATRLQQSGVAVKIIEQDEERCEYLAENLNNVLVIHGDGTDSDLLHEENLAEMDALISLTGHDEENLLLALLGKQQGIGKVVAKVSRSNFIPIIEQLGIDRAVNPVLISAGEAIRFIQGGQVQSLSLLFDGQAEVVEIIASENAGVTGQKLADLGLPRGVIIGAIVHNGEVIIPDGNSVIQPEDRVIVFCLASEVAVLEKLFYRQKGGLFRELWASRKGNRKSSTD